MRNIDWDIDSSDIDSGDIDSGDIDGRGHRQWSIQTMEGVDNGDIDSGGIYSRDIYSGDIDGWRDIDSVGI